MTRASARALRLGQDQDRGEDEASAGSYATGTTVSRAESKTLTVKEAVTEWLEHGLVGKEPSTIQNRRTLAERHVIPALGQRKLVDLTTRDIDRFLAHKATTLSTSTVARLLSILRRPSAEHRPRT